MKQSDIFTVAIIAVVGTLAAYFIVNAFLGNPADATYSIKIIEGVTADLASPDPEVFNKDAINPTIEVYVGDCEDVDQNGIIDKAELVNCGKISVSDIENGDFGDDESGEDNSTDNNSSSILEEGE